MTTRTIARVAALVPFALAVGVGPALAQQGEWQARARVAAVFPSDDSETIADLGTVLTLDTGPGLAVDASYNLTRYLTASLSVGSSYHTMTTGRGVFADLTVGDVWLGSAALTLQLRPPLMGKWHPYLGLGVAYGRPFAFSLDDEAAAVGLEDLELTGDLGWAVEAGVMYDLDQTWFLELAVSGSALTTEATLTVDPGLEYTTVPMDLDPWQVSLGFGRRF